MSYKLSLPADYDPKSKKKYPTVVHLHGYGGPKAPTEASANSGGAFQQYYRKLKDPIIVIFPQWDGGMWSRPEAGKKVINLLNYEMGRLAIDRDRVYLTGQSMGGYGSFDIAAQHPKVFAAVAPFSSGWGRIKGKTASVPKNLSPFRSIPYWAAHGMRDNVVPYVQGKSTVEAMRRGGVYVRFTSYPKAAHHVKQFLYNDQRFFDWLLAQKRGTLPNYELSVDDGKGAKVAGFFEPRTARKITARAPDKARAEVFTGWTCASGSTFEHTTTNPLTRKARFGNAKALTTTFTMPEGDVIVTANYRVGGK
jgi:predicted esterase